MVALGTVILRTSSALKEKGIADARLEAELLLSHVLQTSRRLVLASPERLLTSHEAQALERLVGRRMEREPLAYLLGRREFYGLDFAMGSGVFIPRPETELLVEQTLLRASKRAAEQGEVVIAEPGTGSGAISIVLASRLASARIYATDTSPEALKTAYSNIIMHGVSSKVTLLQGDLLTPLPARPDIIVSNLPYVASGDIPGLQPEVQWEPRLALDGGSDGLDVIRSLLDQTPGRLKENGTIILEIDPHQVGPLDALTRGLFPTAATTTLQDLAHLDRVFIVELS